MPQNNRTALQENARRRKPLPMTSTRMVIDKLGGDAATAKLVSRALGYRYSRQAMHINYRNGHLPFAPAEKLAGIMARAANKLGLPITKMDLLSEVPVPPSRLRKVN